MLDPGKVIQNKAAAITSAAGEPFGTIQDLDFNPLTKGLSASVANYSSSIKVLENQFANGDVAGKIGNDLAGLTSKFASATGEFADIFPPSLNKFANGFGTAAGAAIEDYVKNIVPGAASTLANFADRATAAIEDVYGELNSLTTPIKDLDTVLQTTMQQYSQIGKTTRLETYPSPGPGVVIKNQLEKYASYNCIFTLGVLSAKSINNPVQTYKTEGADYTILRSGGGGIDDKRIQTAYDALGKEAGNLEYFIDNFELDSVIAPSRQAGVAQAMQFSFQVQEPYSMGLFLQALQASAFQAGFQNYLQAPYMLEIDFVGWNDDGIAEPIKFSNRKIPFKLMSVEFDVEKGGSTYTINCIPWNESALMNEIMNIQDSIEITGANVFEALCAGEQSLSTALNQKLQEVAEASGMPSSDFYLIRFPSVRDSGSTSLNASATNAQNSATTTDRESVASRLGANISDAASRNITEFFSSIGLDDNSSSLLSVLRGSAVSDLNPIGASTMLDTVNARGDSPFGLGLYTWDEEKKVYLRDGIELTISDTNRTFKFNQGTPITKIIEEIILVSTYGKTALNLVNQEGNIPWFKIEPKVYIIEDPDFENVTGKSAKIYVYDVVRYDVNVSQFSSPNKTVKGNIDLAKQAPKSYNYIYSGKNTDVLGFDVKFNAAFFEAFRADLNQLGGSQQNVSRDGSVADNPEPTQTQDTTPGGIPEGQTQSVSSLGFTSNNFNATAATNLARQLHNTLLNSDVDLITAEMEIWGDPYFIPDSGLGNYTAAQGPSINITADGSIDHQRSEVDVLVNFRTPIDYSSQTGMMEFPGDTIPVDSFSGLYKVLQITTSISGNKFTQTLKMIRRKNQSTDGISTAKVMMENPQAQSLNPNNRPLAERIGKDPSERTTPGASNPISRPLESQEQGELVTIRTRSGKTVQVAKIVSEQFQNLIWELEDFYGYEIRSIGGYADRNSIGSSRPSYHASGLAIDINATDNAYVKPRPAPAPNYEPTDMPEAGTGSEMAKLAKKHGLGWGGDWKSSIDAMHFSAAKAEGGTLNWPRNGLVPKAPDQEANTTYDDAILRQSRQPPQAQTNTNTSTTATDTEVAANQGTTPLQPVESTFGLEGSQLAAWKQRYGQTHNPDGTPKTAAQQTQEARPTVSGTVPVTQASFVNTNQIIGGLGDALRPYLPTETNDNLYNFNTGDKILATLARYNAEYRPTTTQTQVASTDEDPDANDPRNIA